ncbi:MAG: apolipoprotein N-acyltransferase [Rhodothermales bacterium]
MTALTPRRPIDDFNSPFWILGSGLLLGFSFPPFPTYMLAYVALVPLLIRWSRLPLGWMLLREAYSTFLVMTAIAGHWVLFHENALTALTSGLGLLLIPVPFTLPVVAAAVVKRRFGFKVSFVVLVSSWLAVEYGLSHGPGAMPWLLLGNTQANAPLFNQFADIAGVGGLSLWIWLVNGAIFWTFEARPFPARVAMAVCGIALFVAPIVYGQWRLPQLEVASETTEVAYVQPAVTPQEWANVQSGVRVDLLASLSSELLRDIPADSARPSLIVWPETALPVYPDARRQRDLYARLGRWTDLHGVSLLTGAITRYDSAPALTVEAVVAEKYAEVTPYYNSALFFDASARPQQYDKIYMIPFAERVPLVEWRPALAALGVASGGVGGYGLGRRGQLLERGGSRFGTLICYESLFGDHVRELVGQGAEFLVVLAQDGWWGQSAGYQQHFALTRLRAVETRRAVLMSTVTGRSGLIHSDGSAPETTGWMERTVEQVAVPILHEPTYYTLHGDWIGRGALGLSLLLALAWGFVVLFFPRWRNSEAQRARIQRGATLVKIRQ